MRRSTLLLLTLTVVPCFSQPPRPAGPEKYDVEIRYRIDAFRNERARQFLDMMRDLKSLGFERDPDDDARGDDLKEVENSNVTRMKGTLPAKSIPRASRLRPVLSLLLKPAGVNLPAPDQPVRVELELNGELSARRQRVQADEVLGVLRQLGFRQPIGYHNNSYTRLVGGVPAGQLEAIFNDIRRTQPAWSQLPKTLLDDLRKFPGGADSLRLVMASWYENPEGLKLLLPMLEAWVIQPEAYRYVTSLPAPVVNDSTLYRELKEAEARRAPIGNETKTRLVNLIQRNEVVREAVLEQVQRNQASAPFLTILLQEVFKSKSGPELMDSLLRRLEGREAAILLPQMFRTRSVIRVVEARPDLPVPDPRLPPPLIPEEVHKLEPSFRELLKDMAQANNPRRLDLILTATPEDREQGWLKTLVTAAPSLIVEGRIGQIVSVRMKPSEALALSRLPIVSGIRLPREARSSVLRLPDEAGDTEAILRDTLALPLLRLGKPLKPVRVALVESDFRGWKEQVGKTLPATTRLLDLTLERNDNLQGDPFTGPANELGNGTLMGMALAKAAPWCELILVRVDPTTPHQLTLFHRRLLGEEYFTESLLQRRIDLLQGRQFLSTRQRNLLKEREDVLKLFVDERPQEDPIHKARQERLAEYRKRQDQFDADEKTYQTLEKAYLRYFEDLTALKDVRVVVCGLNWVEGVPTDGGSRLTRRLDDSPGRRFLWVQAAGNARGQAWSGLFRDEDGNGVMEFADAKTPLPKGSWGHELAFLAWQPYKGEISKALPARKKFRVTLQWREAQDPEYTKDGEDPFRGPLSQVRLLVVKQLDPEGAKRPSDDLSTIAESQGPPIRVVSEKGSAVYEHVVEFEADAGSRLALRVEGLPSTTTRPPGVAELPESYQFAELKPRLFIETLDTDGRLVFEHYAKGIGEFGTPGDSRNVLVVGALDGKGKAQPYSSSGSPYGLELIEKPDLRMYDRLGLLGAKHVGGNGMSAAFVGGCAASLVAHDIEVADLIRELRRRLKALEPTK